MAQEAPSPDALARRLVEAEAAPGDAANPRLAKAHAACERAYLELTRWVGPRGCHALFARALRGTRKAHAALAGIEVRLNTRPAVDGISGAAGAAEVEEVAVGLEALLASVLALLGRFIGDDMVVNIVGRMDSNDSSPGAGESGPGVTGEAGS